MYLVPIFLGVTFGGFSVELIVVVLTTRKFPRRAASINTLVVVRRVRVRKSDMSRETLLQKENK